jgi:hypothetical protein
VRVEPLHLGHLGHSGAQRLQALEREALDRHLLDERVEGDAAAGGREAWASQRRQDTAAVALCTRHHRLLSATSQTVCEHCTHAEISWCEMIPQTVAWAGC